MVLTFEQMFDIIKRNVSSKNVAGGEGMMMYELQPGMFIAKRRKKNFRKLFLFRYFTDRALIFFLVVFLMILSLFFVTKVKAREKDAPIKTVTSVCICPGDSLWSIAETFYTPECGDFLDYIAEIKRSNGLRNDDIHAGAYLIVPYFTNEKIN